MNNDLISRQQAIDAVFGGGRGTIKERLEALPSAQSDIIRCKDCKYWDTTWQNDYAPNYHYCPMIDGTHRNDFYCADAERREVTT